MEEMSMKIVIGNDHSAVELKNIIKAHLEEKGYEVMNVGTVPLIAAITRYMEKKWAGPWLPAKQTWALPSAAPAWGSPWLPTR